MTIRKATPEDIEQLSVLFDLYRVHYYQPSDIMAAKKFLLERMKNNESVIFIAAINDKLVGFTQLYPVFSSVSIKKAWVLNDLYVHASVRKQGVAAQLLEAAKQHGIQTQSRYLVLQTHLDNFTAQSVYEKNGWQRLTDIFYELPLPE
jgi:GNAT superfamily N-acetyltransferase